MIGSVEHERRELRYRVAAIVLAVTGVGLAVAMWSYGGDYYRQDTAGRLDHALHESLRASGPVGNALGFGGVFLILANLLYLVRKHSAILQGRGTLRLWMGVHVSAGLAGCGMVLFHSAFQVRNLIAETAAWALGVLVVTGLMGRYLYGLLPRGPEGQELDSDAARVELEREGLAELLRALPGDPSVESLGLAEHVTLPGNLLLAVLWLPLLPLQRLAHAARLQRVRSALRAAGLEPTRRRAVIAGARSVLRLRRQVAAGALYRNLFVWWRALHRAFAIVMALAMLVHVGVAFYYGYRLSL